MTDSEQKAVVVDMFCGAGGESQGIQLSAEKAGIDIEMFAINHWQRAIETHQANFPDAEHICRDVADIHPPDLVPGRNIKLLWMSPECTNHSPARGDKPMNNQSRCSAFTLFDWINKMTVDRVIVENVPTFENWGPIDEETKRPIKGREGETFKAWIAMIRSFDFTVDYRKLNAADYGAPTSRSRLFVQAVRNGSGKSILWPEPSHARPGPNHVLTQELPCWIPARERRVVCDILANGFTLTTKEEVDNADATPRNQTLVEWIKDLEEIVTLSERLLRQFPDDLSLKFSKQQASDEIKRIESLRTTAQPREDPR